MDGGAVKMTLLGTIIRSRIQTVRVFHYFHLFFFFLLLHQIKNSGHLVWKQTLSNVDPSRTALEAQVEDLQ